MAVISISDSDGLEELMASSLAASIKNVEDDDEELDCNELDFIPPGRAAEDEKELAKEMQQLSFGERQEALFDIHGVAKKVEETDEIIRKSLAELEVFIEANKNTQFGASYKIAEYQSPDYVKDKAFRLKFLRTDDFDAKLAASRMFRHFDLKLELFGETKVSRNITLADMDEETMECMKNGHAQWLPLRDQAGRAIRVIALPFLKTHWSYESIFRVMFYCIMAGSDDEYTQKKGIISIMYMLEAAESAPPNPRLGWKSQRTRGALPLFNGCLHICVNNGFGHAFGAWFIRLFNKKIRLRFRLHHGTHKECMSSLMTFGIPVQLFPVSENGELLRQNQLEWIEARRAVENKNSKDTAVLLPRSQDILCGRGKGLQNHMGNARLRLVMESHFAEYESVDKKEKTTLASRIVQEMKSEGSCFLKRTDGVWEQVPNDVARSKVSHFFRNLRGTKGENQNAGRKRDRQI